MEFNSDKPFESYIGGKGAEGVIQNIINCIPEHEVLVELFAGNITLTRFINPPKLIILNDINPKVIEAIKRTSLGQRKNVLVWNYSFEIAIQKFKELKSLLPSWYRFYIYADPPFPMDSRKSNIPVYDFEMSDETHYQLLELLKSLPDFDISISTYENGIYKAELSAWKNIKYNSQTRKGIAVEWLYMNYLLPDKLHDWRYLGNNCADRQRIKRKTERLIEKLAGLPVQERNKILSDLNSHFNGAGEDSSDFTVLGNILIDHR